MSNTASVESLVSIGLGSVISMEWRFMEKDFDLYQFYLNWIYVHLFNKVDPIDEWTPHELVNFISIVPQCGR